MTDKEEREQVLETLTNMRDWMEATQQINSTPEIINALNYAISSIKTDLKYDLLYEDNQIADADKMIPNNSEIPTGSTTKNNLAVEPIDRVELLRAMNTWDKFGYTTRYGLERLDKDDKGFVPYVKYDDMLKCVRGMSSVTPKGVTVTDFADRCRECGKQNIVTCKDCKHRDPEDKFCDCGHTIKWSSPRKDNFYCADGER